MHSAQGPICSPFSELAYSAPGSSKSRGNRASGDGARVRPRASQEDVASMGPASKRRGSQTNPAAAAAGKPARKRVPAAKLPSDFLPTDGDPFSPAKHTGSPYMRAPLLLAPCSSHSAASCSLSLPGSPSTGRPAAGLVDGLKRVCSAESTMGRTSSWASMDSSEADGCKHSQASSPWHAGQLYSTGSFASMSRTIPAAALFPSCAVGAAVSGGQFVGNDHSFESSSPARCNASTSRPASPSPAANRSLLAGSLHAGLPPQGGGGGGLADQKSESSRPNSLAASFAWCPPQAAAANPGYPAAHAAPPYWGGDAGAAAHLPPAAADSPGVHPQGGLPADAFDASSPLAHAPPSLPPGKRVAREGSSAYSAAASFSSGGTSNSHSLSAASPAPQLVFGGVGSPVLPLPPSPAANGCRAFDPPFNPPAFPYQQQQQQPQQRRQPGGSVPALPKAGLGYPPPQLFSPGCPPQAPRPAVRCGTPGTPASALSGCGSSPYDASPGARVLWGRQPQAAWSFDDACAASPAAARPAAPLLLKKVDSAMSLDPELPPPSPRPTTDVFGSFVPQPGLFLQRRYRIVEELGRGTFAVVVSAVDTLAPPEAAMVAIKVVKADKAALADADDEVQLMRDINAALLRQAKDSPPAVPTPVGVAILLDSFFYDGHRCLVLPLYGGSLYQALQQRNFRGLAPAQVAPLAYSMLLGLAKIHAVGVIHCDLKPENVVYTSPGSDDATVVDLGGAYREKESRLKLIQTIYYRAPEVILGAPWAYTVDTWSAACIIFELLTGRPLFKDDNPATQIHTMQDILEVKVPQTLLDRSTNSAVVDTSSKPTRLHPCPSTYVKPQTLREQLDEANVPHELHELLLTLLHLDPNRRSLAHTALKHRAFDLLLPPPGC
ncbi:Dual specificity tyrosine-phosphorylation-regulated kinase mbk-2 [Diplonema papillatum]|nr:Dual specificity tyrosine-phosphorylation-regulated kinase mbk-2 [Diplonema papillatum]